jgi:hypothetical protein
VGVNVGTSAANTNIGGRECAREGLIVWLDAANPNSNRDGSNDWYDLSQNANDATGVNIETGDGENNGYWDLDGSNEYFNISNSLGTLTSFTLEVWAKRDDTSGPEYYIDSRNGASSYFWFLSEYNSYDYNFHNRSRFNDSNSYTTWHQVVVTENSGGSAIYLNGVQKDTGTTSSGIGANMRIGARYTAASPWNGQMAIVRVYNRDISESEILYNWHTNRGRFGI